MVEHPAVNVAAPSGNGWMKNQVNSGKPKVAAVTKVILSQAPIRISEKVQRLERKLVLR